MIEDVITITGTLSEVAIIRGTLSSTDGIVGEITVPEAVGGRHYRGSYTVTPSSEVQILNTKNMIMESNVTINPIPSNYGLITWDGTTLTIS